MNKQKKGIKMSYLNTNSPVVSVLILGISMLVIFYGIYLLFGGDSRSLTAKEIEAGSVSWDEKHYAALYKETERQDKINLKNKKEQMEKTRKLFKGATETYYAFTLEGERQELQDIVVPVYAEFPKAFINAGIMWIKQEAVKEKEVDFMDLEDTPTPVPAVGCEKEEK